LEFDADKNRTAGLYFKLAKYWFDIQHYDEALTAVENGLSLTSQDFSLLNTRAIIYKIQGQYQKSFDDLSVLISKGVVNEQIIKNKAIVEYELGNIVQAIQTLGDYLTGDNDSILVQQTLVWLYYQLSSSIDELQSAKYSDSEREQILNYTYSLLVGNNNENLFSITLENKHKIIEICLDMALELELWDDALVFAGAGLELKPDYSYYKEMKTQVSAYIQLLQNN
jgi:tetratricopeptide (TPR) repeat protein